MCWGCYACVCEWVWVCVHFCLGHCEAGFERCSLSLSARCITGHQESWASVVDTLIYFCMGRHRGHGFTG